MIHPCLRILDPQHRRVVQVSSLLRYHEVKVGIGTRASSMGAVFRCMWREMIERVIRCWMDAVECKFKEIYGFSVAHLPCCMTLALCERFKLHPSDFPPPRSPAVVA